MSSAIDHVKMFSAVKSPLYYGTPFPLVNEAFEQDKINPYGISAESGVLCFSTSSIEAHERYAAPPQLTPGGSFEEVLSAYKSEWFSKTQAMACKQDDVLPGGSPSQNTLNMIRDEINGRASPVIYKAYVMVTKPFVCSDEIPIHSSKMNDSQRERVTKHFGHHIDSVNIDNYIQALRVCFITRSLKKITMPEAVLMADKAIGQFVELGMAKPEKMSTRGFYAHLRQFFKDHGLESEHTSVFNGIHDCIVIDNPGKDFSNANYGDNKHVMVFDVNRVLFALSGKFNPWNYSAEVEVSR